MSETMMKDHLIQDSEKEQREIDNYIYRLDQVMSHMGIFRFKDFAIVILILGIGFLLLFLNQINVYWLAQLKWFHGLWYEYVDLYKNIMTVALPAILIFFQVTSGKFTGRVLEFYLYYPVTVVFPHKKYFVVKTLFIIDLVIASFIGLLLCNVKVIDNVFFIIYFTLLSFVGFVLLIFRLWQIVRKTNPIYMVITLQVEILRRLKDLQKKKPQIKESKIWFLKGWQRRKYRRDYYKYIYISQICIVLIGQIAKNAIQEKDNFTLLSCMNAIEEIWTGIEDLHETDIINWKIKVVFEILELDEYKTFLPIQRVLCSEINGMVHTLFQQAERSVFRENLNHIFETLLERILKYNSTVKKHPIRLDEILKLIKNMSYILRNDSNYQIHQDFIRFYFDVCNFDLMSLRQRFLYIGEG